MKDAEIYESFAVVALLTHAAWILWVIFGALWTRTRPLLALFHIASILWGIVVEISALPCPLTFVEQLLETKAGTTVYHGSFLLHYLEAIVYPHVPQWILVGAAIAVCLTNLAIYVWRYRT